MAFSFDSRIRYSEVDSSCRLSLTGLTNYFQDCSVIEGWCNMNKNFLRIINLIEELGSEKKTPITIQQYQDIINKSSNLWMSNGVDEAFRFIRSYFNFID